MRQLPGCTVLVIGHRATFYALEHLVKGVTLRESGDVAMDRAAKLELSRRTSLTWTLDLDLLQDLTFAMCPLPFDLAH
jgi:hypothetical protein